MLDEPLTTTIDESSKINSGGGYASEALSTSTVRADGRPVAARVALYVCMVLALAMTMLFAMPNGAFADGDVPTDGTDAAQTEQPADGTEEAASTTDDSATAGEQTGEGEQPADEGGEGEAPADNDGTVDGDASVEGEGDSPETVLLTDSTLGAIQTFSADNSKATVDPDTTNGWENFTAPGGVTSTQNVGRIWTDKSVFDDTYTFGGSEDLSGKTVEKGNSDFLVVLSALSSTSNLKETVQSSKPLDIVLVLDESTSMNSSIGGWGSGSRLNALKTAANNFIDATVEENSGIEDEDLQHRLAIVTFSDNADTEIGLTAVNNRNASRLHSVVNGLRASGNTYPNEGFDEAGSVLKGARDNAQKVVIFFTDGVPAGPGTNDFDQKIATDAINSAHSLKNNGALVYSVGLLNGADADDTRSDFNKYMNAVSSNYPDATATFKEGDRWWDDDEYNVNLGTGSNQGYYKTPSTAEDLNNVFQEILDSALQETGSGSPIEENTQEGNTKPGNLVFTDQLGSYMQVTGTGAGDDAIQLAYGDQIYTSTSKSTSGNVDTYHFEGTVGGNAVYGEANLADLTVEVTHSTDLATGDIVKVTIPASLIPMRNYNVDTDNDTMGVSPAYPVRLFYGVSLKADTEKALNNPTSDDYQAIVASQATDSTIDFYSNNFVEEQADGETTASFEPNAGNKFYYYTQNATLYVDESCRTEATNQNIGDYNTLYWKDTYWVQTANGGAEERSVGVAIQRGSAEWNAMVKEDSWNGAYYIPAGTQRSDRPATLTSAKGENKTGTATNVLNPSWNDNGTVTQALGNNGKLSFAKPGSLEIKKTVNWGNASDDTKTNHNSFSFDITATAPTGEDGEAENLNGTYNYFVNGAKTPSGTVEFKDGNGTVTMNGGDTLVIEGLPAGASFTVDEQNANSSGFSTTDATSQADAENDNTTDGSVAGTIMAGSQVSLTFTNTYHATDVNLNTNTTLKVQKTLEGRDWRDGDSFDFTIDGFYAPTGVSGAPEPENTTMTVDAADKDANYTASFGDITFSAPGEYRYTVQEVSDPAEPIAGIDYSGAIYRVTVMVGDSGTGALTVDSVKIERMNNDDGIQDGSTIQGDTMTFTNTYKADSATQGIQGKKSYTDTTGGNPYDANKFTFKLEAQGGFVTNGGDADDLTIGAADTPMPEGAENNAITTGNTGPDFTFPSISFDGNDVGNTYVYKVTEQQGNEQGMSYSKAEHTVMIKVEEETDDDGTHIKATVLGDYADPSKLVFENEYKPTEAKLEGSSAIHGTKTLTGRDMQDGETYYFQLTAVDDNAKSVLPSAEIATVTKADMENGSAGFTFADMSFTKVGTYTFAVNEVASDGQGGYTETSDGSGMTYDTNVATVRVVVSDTKNGSLKAEVSYSNDKHGETTDQALFTNVYEASMNYGAQGKGGINVTKMMKDRPMTAGEFSFSIAGTDSSNVTADEANQKLVDGDKNFQNVAAGEGVTSSMVKLQNVSFNQNDAGKTFSYIVDETTEENAQTLPGVVCDKSQYRVDIQVVDNGNGSMHTVTTVTQTKDANGNDVSTVVIDKANSDAEGYTAPTFGFTNDYNPNPAKVGEDALHQIQVKKTVTGADSATDYTFTLTATGDNIGNITGLDENHQLTVKTDGTIKAGESQTKTFGDLTFSEPGTYTFTVQENQPDEDAGWTFDTTARTVQVVVTDLNDNQEYDGNLYIASVTGSPVEITNSYEAKPVIVGGEGADQQITVQKSVTGKNPDGDFNFKIEPVYDDTYTEDVWKQNVEPVDENFDAQTTVSGVTTEQSQTAPFAGIKFKATGEYKFKITEVEAHDETANPAGWTYDTHESFATVTVTDNGEGQLVATVTYDNTKATTDADKAVGNAAAFTNSYTPGEVSTGTDANTGIQVTKEVTGHDATEPFGFSLSLAEGQDASHVFEGSGDQKTAFDGMTLTTSDGIEAGATETDTFGTITFTAEGDYKFVIDETTEKTDAGWMYDTSTHEVTVHVADQDGKLVITGIDDNAPKFTNKYDHGTVTLSGDSALKVQKTVTGAPTDVDFTFTATFDADASGKADNPGTIAGIKGATEGQDFVLNATVGDDFAEGDAAKSTSFGEVTFTQPGTYIFNVVETNAAPAEDSGWTYDGTTKTITVTVTDNGKGALEAKVAYDNDVEGAADGDKTVDNAAAFTNTYKAGSVVVGGDDAEQQINVQKTLTGRDWQDGDTFEFVLTAQDNAPMPAGEGNKVTITDTSDPKIASFGEITYDTEGTYTYTVSETKGTLGGVTYDGHSVTVTVSVTDADHDGKLDATVSYDNNAATTDADKQVENAAAFTNAYNPNATEFDPNDAEAGVAVIKDVTGDGTTEQMGKDGYGFTLVVENVTEGVENPSAGFDEFNGSAISDGDGAVTFNKIMFTQAGIYRITVTENLPADAVDEDPVAPGFQYGNVTYDQHTFTYTVNVTDDKTTGSLVATVDANSISGSSTFTNVYTSDEEKSVSSVDGDVKTEVNGEMVGVGDTLEYTIGWANNAVDENGAPVDATVTVTDTIPSGTQLVEGSISEDGELSDDGTTITWTIDAAAAQAGTVSFQVTVTEDAVSYDSIRNQATITIDGNSHSTNVVETTVPEKGVSANEGESADNLYVGQVLNYSIAWTNKTGADAVVEVTDTLPDSLTYVGVTGETPEPTMIEGQTLTWNLGTQSDDAAGVITFQARVNENAVETGIGNTATVKVGDNKYATNTTPSTMVATSDLIVTKTVVPQSGASIDTDKEFNFTVSLTDAAGNPLTGEYVLGDTPGEEAPRVISFAGDEYTGIAPGTATFTLSHGERIVILGLPVGAKYTVTEVLDPTIDAGYTQSSTNASGTLETAGATVTATFTNVCYNPDEAKDVSINDSEESGDGQMVGVGDELTYTIDWMSNALDEAGNPTSANIIITDYVPAGTELVADSISDGGAYDKDTYTITWNLGEQPFGSTGTVSFTARVTEDAVSGTVTNDATVTIGDNTYITNQVTNPVPGTSYDAQGDLNITKTLSGRDMQAGEFQIAISADAEAMRRAGLEATDECPATLDIPAAAADETVTINPLARVVFSKTDVDNGTSLTYTISEVQGSLGGITYDRTEYRVTLQPVMRDNTLTILTSIATGEPNKSGEIVWSEPVEWDYANGNPTITFNNTYSAPEVTLDGAANLGVEKLIDGRDWNDADSFIFTLTAISGPDDVEVPMPEGAVGRVATIQLTNALKRSNFGDITYDTPGTYIYTITEDRGQDTQMTYDESVYTVTVTVADAGTGLINVTMEQTTAADGTVLETPATVVDKIATFTNTYAKPAIDKFNLYGVKYIEGRDFQQDDSFTFTVSASEGAPMPSGVDESGSITITPSEGDQFGINFGNITFANEGTYTYTITEEQGNDPDITYDTATRTVTVEVTYNSATGSYEVSAAYSVDGTGVDGLAWTNVYTTPAPTPSDPFNFEITKELNGAQLTDGMFAFQVTDNQTGAVTAVYSTAGSEPDAQGVSTSTFDMLLSDVVYDTAGQYTYTVTEINDGQPGVTYDTKAFQLVVNVAPNEDNHLVATPSVKVGTIDENGAFQAEGDVDAIVFSNSLSATPTAVTPQVTKTLDGRSLVEGEFTFDMTVTDPVGATTTATATNAADGTVTFDEVQFTSEGTYTIAISEQLPDGVSAENPVKDGVTYDTHTVTYTYQVARDLSTNTLVWSLASIDGSETFDNTYYSTTGGEGSVEIVGTKSITGREMTDDDVFTFVLTNQTTGAVAATATNNGSNFLFKLGYTNADFTENAAPNADGLLTEDIVYTVTELDGGETIDGVLYDGNSYEVTVTLTDDGKGHIDAQVGYPENGLAFENVYTGSDVTSQTLAVGKTLNGRDMAKGEFSFGLYTYDPTTGTMGTEPIATTTNDAAANGVRGNVAFGALSYTAADLGDAQSKTFYYAITEIAGTDKHIDYNVNGSVFYAGVTVTNDGQGNLSSTQAYYTDATCSEAILDSSQAPCFVNAYTPDSVAYPITGFKTTDTVDAAPLPEGLTFGYEIVNVNDANDRYVGTSPAKGAINASVTVDGTGTFTYRITEVHGGTTTGGIAYDGSVYYLVLNVSTDPSTGAYVIDAQYYLGDPNNGGTPVESVSFTNTYGDEVGTKLDLSATKTLSGATFEQLNPFGFTVTETTNGMNEVVATGTTKGATGTETAVDLSTISYSFRVEQPEEPAVDEDEQAKPEEGEATEGGEGADVPETTLQPGEGTDAAVDEGSTPVEGGDMAQPGDDAGTVIEPPAEDGAAEDPAAPEEPTVPEEPAEPVAPETPAAEETPAQPEVIDEMAEPEAASIADLFVASEAIADDGDAEVYTGAVIDETAPVVNEAAPVDDAEVVAAPAEPRVVSSDLGLHTYEVTENIPVGAVQNEDGSYTYKGVTYDSHRFVVTVDVEAPYDASTNTVTMTATIMSIDCYDVFGNVVPRSEISFANSYYASTPAQLTGTDIQASKTLTGRTMVDKEFSFSIYAAADNPDGTLNGTLVASGTSTAAEADQASAIEFGTLTFDTPGTYTFRLVENNAGATSNGVTYSTASFEFGVTVTDNFDGTLSAVVNYPEGGMAFTNSYKVNTSTSVTLEGTKTLTGRAMADKEFSFEVAEVMADGTTALVAGGQNTAAGNGEAAAITFAPIKYDQPGEHDYVVTEVNGGTEKNGVTYDTASFSVHVSVIDNLDGTMRTEVTYPEGGIAFKNAYSTDGASVTVTPEASKTLTGRDMVDGEFSFVVTDTANGNVVARGTNTADGTVDFSAITLTATGEYEFTIAEVNGRQTGVTYDTDTFRMLVSVDDDGKGGLTAEVNYPDGKPAFENSYTAPAPAKPAEPQVPKTGDDGNGLAGAAALALGGLGAAVLGGGALLRRRASK